MAMLDDMWIPGEADINVPPEVLAAQSSSPALRATNGLPPEMSQPPYGLLSGGFPNAAGSPFPGSQMNPFAMPSLPSGEAPPPPVPSAPPPSTPGSGPAIGAAGAFPANVPMTSPTPPGPPQGNVPDTSLMGRMGSGFGDLLHGAGNWIGDHRQALAAIGASLLGPGPTIGNRLSASIGPAMQADIRQGQQNQTIQALMGRGLSQDQAMMLATNPAAMQQMLPRLFGVKQQQFTQVGHDTYGNPVYGFVDPISGTVTPYGGSTPTGTGVAGTSAAGGASAPDVHGEDYLKTLDPNRAATVRAIAQGREPFPSGFILKTPYGQWLQSAISQYEPGFNAQTYQQRQKGFNYWYGGGEGDKTMRRLDQAVEHASSLQANTDQLGNWGWPMAPANWAANTANEALGGTAAGPLRTNAHALADELGGIWKGANLSDTEIKAWGDAFPVSGSPTQQKAAVGKLVELVEGGMKSLEDQRQRDLGPVAATLPDPVQDRTRAILTKLKGWSEGGTTASAPASALPSGWTVEVH